MEAKALPLLRPGVFGVGVLFLVVVVGYFLWCGVPKWNGDSFFKVNVHGSGVAVGGHSGVKFPGVVLPTGKNCCSVVCESSQMGGGHFF